MSAGDSHNIALERGIVIGDRYVVEHVLGAGGFGVVYRAHDNIFERTVAIKEFLPADLSMRGDDGCTVVPRNMRDAPVLAEGVTAFLSEARRLRALHHRNIVEVVDFVRAHGTGYLVMPYHEGETLGDLLSRGEQFSGEELLEIADQVLAGLAYVHESKLLHRDISPGNLFIKKDGAVLLIDFGASRHAIGERSHSLSAIVKPGYAPFEQYHAKGNQGPWTDLYALGATLYRCITGDAPAAATERMEGIVESQKDPVAPLAGSRYEQSYGAPLLKFVDRVLGVQASARPQSVEAACAILAGQAEPPRGPAKKPEPRTPEPQRAQAQQPPRPPPSSAHPSPPPAADKSPPERPRGGRAGIFAAVAIIVAALVYFNSTTGATLVVRSEPQTTDVYIDGAWRLSAPGEVNLPSGTYTVELRRDDYESQSQVVTLQAGERRTLSFELRAAGSTPPAPVPPVTNPPASLSLPPGYLVVRSNVSDDSVYINDTLVGPSGPSRYELIAGLYGVRVTKQYYEDWNESVNIVSGEQRTVNALLRLIPNSCEFANDNECDEPGLCPVGTDTNDCNIPATRPQSAPDSCRYARDNECDEPNLCAVGTDTTDCAVPLDTGANSCRFAFDNACDEPDICSAGTDTADCAAAANSCTFANDNECDEPNLCSVGTDTNDCASRINSCQYAFDNECDEPNLCDLGTDSADCR